MDKNLYIRNSFIFLIILSLITGPAIPDIILTISAIIGIFIFILKKLDLNDANLKFILGCHLIIFSTFLFSINIKVSFLESLVDFRYFFYLLLFLYFVEEKIINVFIYFLLFIVCFLFFDLLVQYNYGKDLFGIEANMQVNRQRLNGPFDDEYIIGTYIMKLSLPIIGYFLYLNKNLMFFLILFISFVSIILSGERMALILFIFGVFLILLFTKRYKFLFMTMFLFFISLLFFFLFFPEKNFKYMEFFYALSNFKDTGHGAHYLAAINIFLENPITGSGFKTFREICSDPNILNKISTTVDPCATHPHNLYLEILSETGIIGITGLFLFIFFIAKRIIDLKLYSSKYVGFVALSICIFWPISSMSNFYNNWNASINFTLIGFLFIQKTEKPWKIFLKK